MSDPSTLAMIGLGLSAATSVAGAIQQNKQRDESIALAKEAERNAQEQRESELSRLDEQQEAEQAESQRTYEGQMKDYGTKSSFLLSLIADPTTHPEWASFEEALTKSYDTEKSAMTDAYRRRGITGGKLEGSLTKLQRNYESNLSDELLKLQTSARSELAGLPTPVLGNPDTYGYIPPTSSGQTAQVAASTTSKGADGSGFAQLAGSLYTLDYLRSKKTDEGSTLAESASDKYSGTLSSPYALLESLRSKGLIDEELLSGAM